MNCQEVQLQISEYLEKSLDAIRMKGIETHLSSCPFCRAEVHSLADYIQQVAELPMVEPPAGFAQRVMAHARQIEVEPSGWQRLLGALKTTMPIQAAATVLIAVLAVFLYHKEPRVRDAAFTDVAIETRSGPSQSVSIEGKANAAVEKKASAADKDAAAPAVSVRRRDAARVNQARIEAPQASTESAPQSATDRRSIREEAPVPESPGVAKSEGTAEKSLEGRVAAPRRAPIQAQEISTGSESRRSSVDALGIGAAIGALSRSPFRGPQYSAERALSPLSEPIPDFEFVVRRRPRERTELKEEVSTDFGRGRAAPDSSAGSLEFRAIVPATPVVEIRWFTVLPEHYEHFRKDLAAEANIESEKSNAARERDSAAKASREFLIKVMILQPER
jgi:hypothetical protein